MVSKLECALYNHAVDWATIQDLRCEIRDLETNLEDSITLNFFSAAFGGLYFFPSPPPPMIRPLSPPPPQNSLLPPLPPCPLEVKEVKKDQCSITKAARLERALAVSEMKNDELEKRLKEATQKNEALREALDIVFFSLSTCRLFGRQILDGLGGRFRAPKAPRSKRDRFKGRQSSFYFMVYHLSRSN